jgi:hypothetical protein
MGGGSMQFIDPKGSFLKNLVLSVLLLLMTSLLVPIVLKQIDDRQFVDQQRLQAELARQAHIIDAQAELLDSLATAFWDYEIYAADVLYSRDERIGLPDWHQRAVDTYYEQSGPLLGTMRSEISMVLRLAPRSTYEAFLRLYEEEILPFDSCLLELMKTPGDSPTARCEGTEGKFAGASWDDLTAYVIEQELAAQADLELAGLAEAFRLHDTVE